MNSMVRVGRTTTGMPANTNIPSRADAERAAALLVSAGVSRVMLFGSVARGEAAEDSDLDLVAIYDDLNYTERFARKQELSRLGGSRDRSSGRCAGYRPARVEGPYRERGHVPGEPDRRSRGGPRRPRRRQSVLGQGDGVAHERNAKPDGVDTA